jgi:hypothetical protein
VRLVVRCCTYPTTEDELNGIAEIRRANHEAAATVALLTREQADVAAGVLFEKIEGGDLTNEEKNAAMTLHHALLHDDKIIVEPGEEER